MSVVRSPSRGTISCLLSCVVSPLNFAGNVRSYPSAAAPPLQQSGCSTPIGVVSSGSSFVWHHYARLGKSSTASFFFGVRSRSFSRQRGHFQRESTYFTEDQGNLLTGLARGKSERLFLFPRAYERRPTHGSRHPFVSSGTLPRRFGHAYSLDVRTLVVHFTIETIAVHKSVKARLDSRSSKMSD